MFGAMARRLDALWSSTRSTLGPPPGGNALQPTNARSITNKRTVLRHRQKENRKENLVWGWRFRFSLAASASAAPLCAVSEIFPPLGRWPAADKSVINLLRGRSVAGGCRFQLTNARSIADKRTVLRHKHKENRKEMTLQSPSLLRLWQQSPECVCAGRSDLPKHKLPTTRKNLFWIPRRVCL